MNSPDYSILKYLSERSGETTDANGIAHPLLRIQDLQTLRKTDTYTEAYFSAPGLQFVTRMPDISQYPCFQYPKRKYAILCRLPDRKAPGLTPAGLLELCKERLMKKLKV